MKANSALVAASAVTIVVISAIFAVLTGGFSHPLIASAQTLPPAKGYLGAGFETSKTEYPLSLFGPIVYSVNAGIPNSDSNGSFVFLFSNSTYSEGDFTLWIQSCQGTLQNSTLSQSELNFGQNSTIGAVHITTINQTRTLTSIGHPCSKSESLGLSYGENSKGLFQVTSQPFVVKCATPQNDGSQSQPTFLVLGFGVQTTPNRTVGPSTYEYVIQANC